MWLLLGVVLDGVAMPFVGAGEMGDGPAYGAGPDPRRADDLVSAYHTLVVAIVDVLVNAGGQVWSRGFGCDPGL